MAARRPGRRRRPRRAPRWRWPRRIAIRGSPASWRQWLRRAGAAVDVPVALRRAARAADARPVAARPPRPGPRSARPFEQALALAEGDEAARLAALAMLERPRRAGGGRPGCASRCAPPACAASRAARAPRRRPTRTSSPSASARCWSCCAAGCATPRSPSACAARCARSTTTSPPRSPSWASNTRAEAVAAAGRAGIAAPEWVAARAQSGQDRPGRDALGL